MCHLKIRSATDNKSEAQQLFPLLITVLRLFAECTATNLNLDAGHGTEIKETWMT